MSDFTFELVPFNNEAQRGKRGTVGPYGDVTAFYSKPVRQPQQNSSFRADLVSERLPETYFAGIGLGGRPSLTKGRMRIDHKFADVRYNWRGVRSSARALHVRYEGRAYTYQAMGSGDAVELSRDGVKVAIKNGRLVRGVGVHRIGSTHGAVDEVDLAIALVLEAVDVSSLTLGWAIASSPFKLLRSTGDSGSGGE